MRRLVLLLAVLSFAAPVAAQNDAIRYYPPAGVSGLSGSGTAITSTLPLLLPNGSATAPSYSFSSQAGTGFYYNATGQIRWAGSGTVSGHLSNSGVTIPAASFVAWGANASMSGAQDVYLFRDAANTLALRNGTNAQQFNLYETYTDASNRSYLAIQATAGAFKLLPQAVGTGTLRVVAIGDGGARPTCEAATRGGIWYDAGGAGAADTLEVCRKDAADAYAWVSLF